MKVCKFLFLTILFWCSTNTHASIRPSFALDYCSWEATDVVIVAEGDVIDGNVTVLESLKGDLQFNQTISIPELEAFKSESLRMIKAGFSDESTEENKFVTGSRMVLFLKPKAEITHTKVKGGKAKAIPIFQGASRDGMSVSVVWFEGNEAFAYIQVMNPGDSILVNYGRSENELKDRISEVLRIQQSLDSVIAIRDKSSRAEALVEFASSELYLARELVFEEFIKCGNAALPVLRTLLNDNSKLSLHDDAVESLAKIGGKLVASDLTKIVSDELVFWKTTAPSLKEGWWNQINDSATQILRARYMKVFRALSSLKGLRFERAREIVIEFRDFWRSLPQLEDRNGLDQMSEACDDILKELPSENHINNEHSVKQVTEQSLKSSIFFSFESGEFFSRFLSCVVLPGCGLESNRL